MMFTFVVFVISLTGIIGLFAVKYWEYNRDRVLMPRLRARADMRAAQMRELLVAAREDMSKLPPLLAALGRYLVHEAALGFAALARMAERGAHQLADLVSYRHRFEKRETRSEFLRKVAEHKNGNGEREELDTTV